MLKRTYSFLTIMTASLLFLIACTKDDDQITHFSSVVDVTASSISAQKYTAITVFSTDGGTTFVEFPKIAMGQDYQVKVVDAAGADVTSNTCYILDWSASNPQPTSVTGGIASFKMSSVSDIKAVVTNVLWVADAYVGAYTVVKDEWNEGLSTVNITKVDATHIKINEYPATNVNHKGLVLTIPNPVLGGAITVAAQDNGSYGTTQVTTSGTGLACDGNINLTLTFVLVDPDPTASGTASGYHLVLKKK